MLLEEHVLVMEEHVVVVMVVEEHVVVVVDADGGACDPSQLAAEVSLEESARCTGALHQHQDASTLHQHQHTSTLHQHQHRCSAVSSPTPARRHLTVRPHCLIMPCYFLLSWTIKDPSHRQASKLPPAGGLWWAGIGVITNSLGGLETTLRPPVKHCNMR